MDKGYSTILIERQHFCKRIPNSQMKRIPNSQMDNGYRNKTYSMLYTEKIRTKAQSAQGNHSPPDADERKSNHI